MGVKEYTDEFVKEVLRGCSAQEDVGGELRTIVGRPRGW